MLIAILILPLLVTIIIFMRALDDDDYIDGSIDYREADLSGKDTLGPIIK